MAISYRPMVKVKGEDDWVGNALRFATREEAEANVRDLMMRWLAVTETNVEESSDPANYTFISGELKPIE